MPIIKLDTLKLDTLKIDALTNRHTNKKTPLTMPITIRQAHHSEIDHVVTLWQAIDSFPDVLRPFGGDSTDKPEHAKALIEHTLQSNNAVVLVATNPVNDIIGTLSGHVFTKPAVNIPDVGVIYSLWVDEEYRCQGIGQNLLSYLEKELINKGAKAFQVGWDTSNTSAEAWWQKRGYLPYEVIASKLVDV